MKILILALLAVSTASAAESAKPLTISYDDASNLYTALMAVQPGVDVDNVAAIADNINALTVWVKKYDAVKQAAQHNEALWQVRNDPARLAKTVAEEDKWREFGRTTFDVILTPVNLTKDEIKDSKMTGAILSFVKRFLHSPPKP